MSCYGIINPRQLRLFAFFRQNTSRRALAVHIDSGCNRNDLQVTNDRHSNPYRSQTQNPERGTSMIDHRSSKPFRHACLPFFPRTPNPRQGYFNILHGFLKVWLCEISLRGRWRSKKRATTEYVTTAGDIPSFFRLSSLFTSHTP